MKSLTNCENPSSNSNSGFTKATCDLENCSKSRPYWRKSTNESEGKPDQNFDAALRICRKNRGNAPKEIFPSTIPDKGKGTVF
jgi:hypothetical protein